MRQESDGLYFVFVFHKYHIAHRSLYSIESMTVQTGFQKWLQFVIWYMFSIYVHSDNVICN